MATLIPLNIPSNVLTFAVLVSVLLVPSSARAVPWCVSDTAEREVLVSELDALWPDSPIVLIDAATCPDGFSWEGDVVVMRHDGQEHRRDTHGSVAMAVAFARSWLRELDALGGWVPEPQAETVVLTPVPALETPEPDEPPPSDNGAAYASVGFEYQMTPNAFISGVRIAGGHAREHWSYDVGMFLALRNPTTVTILDRTLIKLMRDSRTSFADTIAFSADVHRYFNGVPEGREFHMRPRLSAGVSIRQYQVRQVRTEFRVPQVALIDNAARYDVSPEVGLGVDVHRGPNVAIVLRQRSRLRFQSDIRQHALRMSTESALSVEMLYRP